MKREVRMPGKASRFITIPDQLRFAQLLLETEQPAGYGFGYQSGPLQQIWDASGVGIEATDANSHANAMLILFWYFAAIADGQPPDTAAERIITATCEEDDPDRPCDPTRENLARGCAEALWQVLSDAARLAAGRRARTPRQKRHHVH